MDRAIRVHIEKTRPDPGQDYSSNKVGATIEIEKSSEETADASARETMRKLFKKVDQEVDRKLDDLGSNP